MAPRRSGLTWQEARRVVRRACLQLALPLAAVVVIFVVDYGGGHAIRVSGLMIAVPALCAAVLGPFLVLIILLLVLPLAVIAAADNETLDSANFPASFATVVVLGIAAVLASAAREHSQRRLSRARHVASVTQRALLPALPTRLGDLEIATLYLASDAEAMIGGDICTAVSLPGVSRVMVGDVRGKGLAAVEITGRLVGSFRRTGMHGVDLDMLPGTLDRALREDLTDTRDGPDDVPEGFVTAAIVDHAEGSDTVRIANCGHPAPLMVHDGTVTDLTPAAPSLPLGLGDLDGRPCRPDTYGLARGATLLLYTDGVTEARDRVGRFYPFAERLGQWAGEPPSALLDRVRMDLLRYVGSRGLADDVAVVAIRRTEGEEASP